jgi:hypothetical protein
MTTTIVTCPWCHAEAMYGQPCPHCNHDVGVPRIECGCRACRGVAEVFDGDPLLTDRDPTPPDTAGEKLRDAVASLIVVHRRRNHAETAYENVAGVVKRALREADVDLPLYFGGYVFNWADDGIDLVIEKAGRID